MTAELNATEPADKDRFGLGIGVGCLWFAAPDDEAAESSEEHFKQVEALLASIENVTNLSVSGADGEYGSTAALVDDETEYYYPNVYWVRIRFDIFIPTKVQDRLDARCGSEKFSVYIENHYHLPIAYAYSADVNDGFDGSAAIILLRRYLEEKAADGTLKFGVIGPSPFHARFFTVKSDRVALIRLPSGVGYTDYAFEHEEAGSNGLEMFTERYGDILSMFYELHNMRRRSLRLQSEILMCSEELVQRGPGEGWWSTLWRPMRLGHTHDEISANILSDQLCRDHMGFLLDEASEGPHDEGYSDLESHFKELRRFQRHVPHTTAADILKTSELRRQNFLTNATVLIAGLFGGIVGAILGSFMTYTLTSSQRQSSTMQAQVAPSELERDNEQPAPTPISPPKKVR